MERSFFEGKRSELAPFTTEERKGERAHLIRYGVRERWINLPSAPRSSLLAHEMGEQKFFDHTAGGYIQLDRNQLVGHFRQGTLLKMFDLKIP